MASRKKHLCEEESPRPTLARICGSVVCVLFAVRRGFCALANESGSTHDVGECHELSHTAHNLFCAAKTHGKQQLKSIATSLWRSQPGECMEVRNLANKQGHGPGTKELGTIVIRSRGISLQEVQEDASSDPRKRGAHPLECLECLAGAGLSWSDPPAHSALVRFPDVGAHGPNPHDAVHAQTDGLSVVSHDPLGGVRFC